MTLDDAGPAAHTTLGEAAAAEADDTMMRKKFRGKRDLFSREERRNPRLGCKAARDGA